MRQVPQYLLIGNGRVARHFRHYFSLLKLSYRSWHRHESFEELDKNIKWATHILVLIKDDAIVPFIEHHLSSTSAKLVHFSGSLITEKAFGAHPLSSFSESLWELSQYQAVSFIVDQDAPALDMLLPGLPNTAVYLSKILKPKYHALCVLSGNFTCLLWHKFFSSFTEDLHLPKVIAETYLKTIMQNILAHPEAALTGPLVRGDEDTIQKNIAALAGDPIQQVYQSFVTYFQQIKN